MKKSATLIFGCFEVGYILFGLYFYFKNDMLFTLLSVLGGIYTLINIYNLIKNETN